MVGIRHIAHTRTAGQRGNGGNRRFLRRNRRKMVHLARMALASRSLLGDALGAGSRQSRGHFGAGKREKEHEMGFRAKGAAKKNRKRGKIRWI